MKLKNSIFTFLAFFSMLLFSCNSENNENKDIEKDTLIVLSTEDSMKNVENKVDTTTVKSIVKKSEVKKTTKVFKYICPQGDKEGNSDKEGICPTCEMDLIENPDYTK